MAQVRSVTIKLRAGVSHAVLPDNRSMVAGTNYVIPYDDYIRFGPGPTEQYIQVVSFNTTPGSSEGIDLTTDTAALPTYTVGGKTFSRKLGQVTEGFLGELFRLVKLVDALDVVQGDVVVWASMAAKTVTADKVGGSSMSPLTFAGVALAAGTHGQFIWVQVDGPTNAKVAADVGLGEIVVLDPTVDKVLRSARTDEVQVITLTGFTGTLSVKLTFAGAESAAIVRGTNATAAGVQAALEGLAGIDPGDISVTGTTDAGPFTVNFLDSGPHNFGDSDVGPITVTSGTGGAAGTVAEGTKGGAASGQVLGTVIAAPAGGKADVALRWLTQRPRHSRRNKNIFART
jgi:hypothetical protein